MVRRDQCAVRRLSVVLLRSLARQGCRLTDGKHLLAHEQIGGVAKADCLQVMQLLLRAQQLQHGHILVGVPADELQQQHSCQ